MADRRNKTVRDMTISMGVIVVGVLILGILNGGFSFSPGKASGGIAATADVQGRFGTAGRTAGFAVIVPKGVPAAWKGSSFSITDPPGTKEAPPTVRAGWLTPDGSYITLIESSGPVAAVLGAEIGQTSGAVSGTVTAGGASWTVSPGVRQETAWTRTAGAVTLLITGNATVADFTTLAGTIVA
ncbi:hypothetical protein ABIB25_003722 [Nakamurella sp. UYEF19]|uniref:DUF4245 domain-containing protein n=1 Tax=Nakamurella sp. UYEF19 TaxID=1756392 RepID=UPI00339119BE